MTVLVELCAGMAAVSHRAVGQVPPVPYMGGKRGYAAEILAHLEVVWPPSRIVLCEADPAVAAGLWGIWAPEGRAACVKQIEAWAEPDEAAHRARWDRHIAEYRAGEWADMPRADLAPRYLWTAPRCGPGGPAKAWWLPQRRRKRGWLHWTWDRPADRLRRLHAVAEVRCVDARDVAPIPGAVCYIDPPYRGTAGYRHGLPRADVIAIAERWRAAGCVVGVSEAEPIEGADEAHGLTHCGGRGRNNFGATSEYLSVWAPTQIEPHDTQEDTCDDT